MRKQVLVPENVEMADIHAIQTRVKKHNLLTVALLIPLFAGYALYQQESTETLGGIVFVLSMVLMVLGFVSGRGDEKRLPAYWAKYQQIHRMDNLLRANLVGVWLCAEARVAVYREGSWAFSTKRRARGKTTSRTRFSRRLSTCANMRRRKGTSRWTWTSSR